MVGEDPIVTQCHVLLLPLLIEGLAAAFEENSLKEKSHESQRVFVPGTSCPLETGLWEMMSRFKKTSRSAFPHFPGLHPFLTNPSVPRDVPLPFRDKGLHMSMPMFRSSGVPNHSL